MDIHNYPFMDIHNWINDIHNSIMDIHKWTIMDIHNCPFMDIHNWIKDIHNWIMDIINWIMDILKETTSLRRCEDVSFDTRRTNQIETYWRRIQIISYVKNISHFICSKYQPLERFRWMPRKNTQRPIDVVKTSVWDVVGTTSLGRCEDVPFNTGRTDQFETYWRRPWDVVCLLGNSMSLSGTTAIADGTKSKSMYTIPSGHSDVWNGHESVVIQTITHGRCHDITRSRENQRDCKCVQSSHQSLAF